jgi:hypothetical protein
LLPASTDRFAACLNCQVVHQVSVILVVTAECAVAMKLVPQGISCSGQAYNVHVKCNLNKPAVSGLLLVEAQHSMGCSSHGGWLISDHSWHIVAGNPCCLHSFSASYDTL